MPGGFQLGTGLSVPVAPRRATWREAAEDAVTAGVAAWEREGIRWLDTSTERETGTLYFIERIKGETDND